MVHRIKVGGKFSVNNLPNEIKDKLRDRLMEKLGIVPLNEPKKKKEKKVNLEKMSKDELEDFAKKKFKVDLDKRKSKRKLVSEVKKLLGLGE